MLFNLIEKFFSIFLTGIVIKLLDDYLDEDKDYLLSRKNLYFYLKKGILPYTLLIFSFAVILNYKYSVSLFLSAYILGMINNFDEKLVLGTPVYTEMIVISVIGCVVFGIKEMFSSIFLIASIQLIDDYIDYEKDKPFKKGFAWKLGKTECLLIFIIFSLISLYLNVLKAIFTFISMIMIIFLYSNIIFTKNE